MTSRDDAPTPGDAVLAAAVAVVLAGIIALSGVGSRTSPGAAAYLFAAGFGAVLLLRRAMPLAVIVLSILGTFAYYTLNLPAIGVALPVAAALYSTAERGRLRTSVISGAVVFLVSLAFRLRDDPQPVGYLLGTDAALNIAVIAAAIALGYAVRARRIQAAQQRQIDRLNREQSARDAEERLRTERESVSRELHDSVGHALSVISLQAGVGQDAVGRDDDAVAKALAQVRAQATSTLTDLRGLVKALRSGPSQAEDDTRHAHSLASIPSLVDDAAAAGLQVTADVDLAGAELSPAVDAAVFRVVQESLTNVVRHSQAHSATVEARMDGAALHLTVRDDGPARPDEEHSGFGIIGMTERVRILGGTLSAGPTAGGGFLVEARMPGRLS